MITTSLSLVLYFLTYRLNCQLYIYPEGSSSQTFDCGTNDCSNNEIYYAGISLVVTCNGNGHCNGLKVYCGTFDPPGSQYDASDMDGSTVNCLIQTSVNTPNENIYFYCNGDNVGDCTFRHTTAGITSSTLECNVPSNAVCKYSCPAPGVCDASNNLLCHSGSACKCDSPVSEWCTISPVSCTSTDCDASNNNLICQSGAECSCYGQCNITETPTTTRPTTSYPTTMEPTTNYPTTPTPTTAHPTTIEPTTNDPTTVTPTTKIATTSTPTTDAPTTNMPTTATTTTQSQSTSNAPTTPYPTSRPTTTLTNFSVEIPIIAVNVTDIVIEDTFIGIITKYLDTLSVSSNYLLTVDVLSKTDKSSVNIIISTNDESVYNQLDKDQLITFIDDNLMDNRIKIGTSGITTTEFNMDNGSNNNDMMNIYIIIGVTAIVLFIVIVIIICWYRGKKQYSDKAVIKMKSELELNNSPTITKNNKNNTNIKAEQADNIQIDKESDSEDMYSDNDVIKQNIMTVGSINDDESDNEKLYDDDLRVLTPNNESQNKGFYCRVIMDYIAADEDQLNLKENGILFIMETVESGWWFGIDENGNDGWIPSNYVEKSNLNKQEQLKQEQKRQTNFGDLIGNTLDNYLLNMDKYLNIKLPPNVVPVVITDFGSSNIIKNDDEYSSDTDIDNETLGQQTNS